VNVDSQSSPAALSTEQLRALADAHALFKPIGKAIKYAKFDGWTLAVFAILTCLCGISSPVALVIGATMGAIAWYELRQANRLLAGDVEAPKKLALNQLALASLLIVYALTNLTRGPDASGVAEIKRQLGGLDTGGMLEQVETLSDLIEKLVYGVLIAIAVLVQGGTALFYLSRKKYVQRYATDVPGWARAVARHG
jgi:hypothetical protein